MGHDHSHHQNTKNILVAFALNATFSIIELIGLSTDISADLPSPYIYISVTFPANLPMVLLLSSTSLTSPGF